MKQKITKKYMIIAFSLLVMFCGFMSAKQVMAASQSVESLQGYYTGPAVEVGAKIDMKNIYLLAQYTIKEGSFTMTDYEEIKSGFKISPSVVKEVGQNEIVVSYGNKTTTIYVPGKQVEYVTADYMGEELYVGAKIPKEKFEVYAYFSDGSYEIVKNFMLSSFNVAKEGMNLVMVTYKEKTAQTYVYGKAPLAVQEIIAYYIGEPLIEGNKINTSHIEAMAVYNDGTMKKISNFTLNPTIVSEEGNNEITLTYGGVSTVIDIIGLERYIEPDSAVATYIGPGVVVGTEVKKEDIQVKVTYNDKKTGFVDDFNVSDGMIWEEGINTVIVYNDEFTAEVIVYGMRGFNADFSNSLSEEFFDKNGASSEVTLAVSWGMTASQFQLLETEFNLMKRVVHTISPTDEFIAFELAYNDDEMVLEFPMGMQVTVPDGYDPEHFNIYYKPKYSNIFAKLDGKFMDDEKTEYQVIAYEPGIYILVNEASERLVTDIVVETEELHLKPNRSYSLKPKILPLNAENKEVTYWCSDEEIATVSETGKITTLKEGTCEIWIEAKDDSGVYTIIYLEVGKGKQTPSSIIKK